MTGPRTSARRRSNSLMTIFALPLAIFVGAVAALVIALTGDGWRDAASWVGLAIPLVVLIWAMHARRS
ncbi:MAG: hypothetical protein B7Y88_11895 [Sphingomonadales bacterium 32-64-17]|nr:MAG: hypothetical protein B7Y88_11895 [Sphingomonadales bacterium 32-64-17]